MKEDDFLKIIKTLVGKKYIGDDCAYIKALGIVITQDSLVEDVHFSMKYMTPYQLGYKSGKVNISDIIASGGIPKYISVALSLPKTTTNEFVEEFYQGLINSIDKVEIIGGDITGSDKIMISITAIGSDAGRRISSRKNIKEGYVVVTDGEYGSSAGGLKLLQTSNITSQKLINSHILPELNYELAEQISKNINEDYAMMDTSDGLADALYKIAEAGNKTIVLDFSKVEYNPDLRKFFPNEYKKMMLFGGEDYKIVAVIPENFADKYKFKIIGRVIEKNNAPLIVENYNKENTYITSLKECFNHFN